MNPTKTTTKKPVVTRPPVVVVLGHIDHGKTTLLDTIRESSIAKQEAGGITQHIGAYHITHHARAIAFIDTPGHEAFSKMRSRGAQVADVAILVVAVDDGVKPQTVEAIRIIETAKIPFVVAINKIDKPEVNSARVKQQLAQLGVQIEEWGGKIPAQEISAKTGQGVSELLDVVLLVADLEELKAQADVPASGVIIESHLEATRGVVATLLIRNGTLSVGEYIVAEGVSGKVKILEDAAGNALKEASFQAPAVLVVGFDEPPPLGAQFMTFHKKVDLEDYLNSRQVLPKTRKEKKLEEAKPGEEKVFKIILKADRQGSLEAIEKLLQNLNVVDVKLEILEAGVGDISETDVKFAASAGAFIFGFNVKLSSEMRQIASQLDVKVNIFTVIYELMEAVQKELKHRREAKLEKITLGTVKVLAIFKATSKSQIIGGKVTSGKIKRGAPALVLRNEEVVGEGTIAQLQHNKLDVAEVAEGLECGLMFVPERSKVKIEVGDVLEVVEQKLTHPAT